MDVAFIVTLIAIVTPTLNSCLTVKPEEISSKEKGFGCNPHIQPKLKRNENTAD